MQGVQIMRKLISARKRKNRMKITPSNTIRVIPTRALLFKHGESCKCDCGAYGFWDDCISNHKKDVCILENAVFYNTHLNIIECHDCCLK